jgi:hypothetical protein
MDVFACHHAYRTGPLNDSAYNGDRNIATGNPYKQLALT